MPLPGGFFDGTTSEEERQEYLLDLIRRASASEDSEPPRSLNEMLARSDAELKAFEAEDERSRAQEEAKWKNMGNALPNEVSTCLLVVVAFARMHPLLCIGSL